MALSEQTMDRTVTCPCCGRIGSIRLQPVERPSGTELFVIGIDGPFVRTDRTSAQGQPLVRCDACDAEIAVERRKPDAANIELREPRPDA